MIRPPPIPKRTDTLFPYKTLFRSHQKKAPVQTIDIAQELGIKVFKVNDWPDNVSAMIRKDAERGGESGFAIYVNGSHPRVRRRFSIAHEIVHFHLHRNRIGAGVTDDAVSRIKLSSAVEVQAKRMATESIMPWHLLREHTDKRSEPALLIA